MEKCVLGGVYVADMQHAHLNRISLLSHTHFSDTSAKSTQNDEMLGMNLYSVFILVWCHNMSIVHILALAERCMSVREKVREREKETNNWIWRVPKPHERETKFRPHFFAPFRRGIRIMPSLTRPASREDEPKPTMHAYVFPFSGIMPKRGKFSCFLSSASPFIHFFLHRRTLTRSRRIRIRTGESARARKRTASTSAKTINGACV